MVCEYLTEFSPCRDHLKVPNRVIEVSGKTCFEANFQFYTVWHCNQNYVHQEGENSVRYSQTIDNQDTKRTSFPDQPFGLGDSWSAGKLMTFQALFSRPAEFGPYIHDNSWEPKVFVSVSVTVIAKKNLVFMGSLRSDCLSCPAVGHAVD